ncbi:hypothetical protein GCM10009635_61230 [Actinocatenispora thailandica]
MWKRLLRSVEVSSLTSGKTVDGRVQLISTPEAGPFQHEKGKGTRQLGWWCDS